MASGKSIWAVAAGVIFIVVVSTLADTVRRIGDAPMLARRKNLRGHKG